jgi:sensor histidine kinase regulating citrate/malate metabolism
MGQARTRGFKLPNKIMKKSGNDAGETKEIREQLVIYKLIFDSIYNGALVTDAEGYITHFNKPYGLFLGLDPDAQIGRHCTEVVENTRMHIVAKTGKPEINQTQWIKEQNMVVQRIPISPTGFLF